MPTLAEALQAKGWTAHTPLGPFTKGDWELDFDTSHWLIVSCRANPRVFDVPALDEYHAAWTANLVEHLCRMEEDRVRLRKAIAAVRELPTEAARAAAAAALAGCYHRWLVNVEVAEGQVGRVFCPICGRRATKPEAEQDTTADGGRDSDPA